MPSKGEGGAAHTGGSGGQAAPAGGWGEAGRPSLEHSTGKVSIPENGSSSGWVVDTMGLYHQNVCVESQRNQMDSEDL